MKTLRAIALAMAALAIGFLAARWCTAQPSNHVPAKAPDRYDFGAMQQLVSFLSYLKDTGQTNTLQRFNDYMNASLASRHNADLGIILSVLQRLRDGRTNEAYGLLEVQLDGNIVGLVASYRNLPASARGPADLKILGEAKDYRAKYPFKHQYPNMDEEMADAFKILDGN